MVITFFGHSDTPEQIQSKLKAVLMDCIEKKGANLFYVGNHGHFDSMVLQTLRSLKLRYPHIDYAVILAYIPGKVTAPGIHNDTTTLFPDTLEEVPPRYAILRRNRWMIEQSDAVITYVKYEIGGAAKCQKLALRKGKTVINLAN